MSGDVIILYILLLLALDIIEAIFIKKVRRRITEEDIEVIREIIIREIDKIKEELREEEGENG